MFCKLINNLIKLGQFAVHYMGVLVDAIKLFDKMPKLWNCRSVQHYLELGRVVTQSTFLYEL